MLAGGTPKGILLYGLRLPLGVSSKALKICVIKKSSELAACCRSDSRTFFNNADFQNLRTSSPPPETEPYRSIPSGCALAMWIASD